MVTFGESFARCPQSPMTPKEDDSISRSLVCSQVASMGGPKFGEVFFFIFDGGGRARHAKSHKDQCPRFFLKNLAPPCNRREKKWWVNAQISKRMGPTLGLSKENLAPRVSAAKKKWLLHAKVEKTWPLYLISWPLHLMLTNATKMNYKWRCSRVHMWQAPTFFSGRGSAKTARSAAVLSWVKSIATQCPAGWRKIMAFVAWAFTAAGRNARGRATALANLWC